MRRKPTPSRSIVLVLIGMGLGFFAAAGTGSGNDPTPAMTRFLAPIPALAREARRPVDVADVAERTVRSVVNVSTTKVARAPQQGEDMSPLFNDPFFRRFFELPPGANIPRELRARSLGSGVIVSAEGVILTNDHVVEEADEIRVTLSDGREFDAEVVGSDPSSDIGVIRLKEPVEGLEPLPFGSSDKLRLGETVLAIGNPFGVGQTVTMGIVSALGRANMGIADYEDFIQTDAAINPGNSGGALINLKGELVGINTAIVSRTGGYQGIGFAIPSDMARSIMDSLLEHGRVMRGWLGVSIQNIDADMAGALGLESSSGVLVADVSPDSPAQEAGFQRGDVVIELNGEAVATTGALRNRVAGSGAGTKVKVTILRDGERKTLKVVLGELPEDMVRTPKTGGGTSAVEKLGMRLSELDDETRERFEIPEKVESGAVVSDLAIGGVAAESGLRPGDVILEIDRREIASVEDATKAIEEGDGERRLLLVWRSGGTSFVVLKLDEDKDKEAEPDGE